MTASYLDQAWVEAQGTELQALQQQLREHLAVIALASGQLPDLVDQLQRLGERELEVQRALGDLRAGAQREMEAAAVAGVARVEEHILQLEEAMAGRAGDVESGLEAQAGVLLGNLDTKHWDLRDQLGQQVRELIASLPASAQAIESLASELRTTVEKRLLAITRETQTEARAWTGVVADLEADLRAGTSRLEERLVAQEQALILAGQATEERLFTDLARVAERVDGAAERDRRTAAQGLDVLRAEQEALEQLLAGLGEGLQRLEETTGTDRLEFNQALESLRDGVSTLERQWPARLEETFQKTQQLVSSEREALEQALMTVRAGQETLERRQDLALQEGLGELTRVAADDRRALEEAVEALEKRQGKSLKTALAEVQRVAIDDRRTFRQGLDGLAAEQIGLRRDHVVLASEIKELAGGLTVLRTDVLELGEQFEASRADVRTFQAEMERQTLTLSEQTVERERLLREEIRRLRGALDEHGRQVRQSLDGVQEEQRDLESRLLASVSQRVTALEGQMLERHEALGDQVEAVRQETGDLRSEVTTVGGRLATFLGWFGRAGTWARLNGKPEP